MWDGTEATWEDWVGRNLTNEHLHGATSGTGAYLITEIAANFEKVTLEAFEGYWAGVPDIDTVMVEQVSEEAARVAAIKSGDADLVDSIGPAGLAELRTSPGVAVLSDETWSSTSISAAMFNFEVAATSPYIGSGVFDGAGIPSDFFADVEIR